MRKAAECHGLTALVQIECEDFIMRHGGHHGRRQIQACPRQMLARWAEQRQRPLQRWIGDNTGIQALQHAGVAAHTENRPLAHQPVVDPTHHTESSSCGEAQPVARSIYPAPRTVRITDSLLSGSSLRRNLLVLMSITLVRKTER
jgi:hypothetical protein